MKLNLSSRKHFQSNPGEFASNSPVRLAEDWSELLKSRRSSEPGSVYWDLKWDCSLLWMPSNDADVIDITKNFFERFSEHLRSEGRCSGVRFVGVYVPEQKNPATGLPNPHCHGLVKFYRKGQNPAAWFADELIAFGNLYVATEVKRTRKGRWLAEALDQVAEDTRISYLTGETLPYLPLTGRSGISV